MTRAEWIDKKNPYKSDSWRAEMWAKGALAAFCRRELTMAEELLERVQRLEFAVLRRQEQEEADDLQSETG